MASDAQRLVVRSHEFRKLTVEMALAVAGMIDAVESGEATAPDDPELNLYRRRVDELLAGLRKQLEDV